MSSNKMCVVRDISLFYEHKNKFITTRVYKKVELTVSIQLAVEFSVGYSVQ